MILRLFLIACFIVMASGASANDIRAVQAAAKGNFNVTPSSATGRDLVQWYKLRKSDKIHFDDAKQFIASHSDWPDLFTIRKNAENAMSSNMPDQSILQWFQAHDPATAKGMDIYLKTLIRNRQTAKAIRILKDWWPKALLTPDEQASFIANYGQYFGSQDHERRLRHIIHDRHYTASRSLARMLGRGYPQLIEAKIALIEEKPNVNALIRKVPDRLQNNDALMLARIQWRRKNNNNTGAIALLNQAPAYKDMADPSAWWRERHIMARRLMEQNKWGSAYQLVSTHRQVAGFPMAQAEFLAGWIALRKIGKPWEGFKHFEKLFNNVKSPISRARGAYWAGLASETLDYPDIANQWYQVGAKYQTTFYGQMAAQRINLPFGLLKPTAFQITDAAKRRFNTDPLIRAVSLLKQADRDYDARQFLTAYIESRPSGLEYKLAADYAHNLGYEDAAVRIAKKAERDGYIMPQYLFPVIDKSLHARLPIHPAFSHGIMRQESAFNQTAQSHAGALGLMQLMPATARETARKAGMRYSKRRLTTDPVYNMTLGSLYIKQMLDQFDGNRTLAMAAYNAGPGRVNQWLKEIGDPRDPDVDEVDWIESIPIYETRNYVQRVTEAINVYAGMMR